MSPGERVGGVLSRLADIQRAVERLDGAVEKDGKAIALLEEQIGGDRGLNEAVKALAEQVSGLRRAAWWLAGIIVTSSIGFAFSVMLLIGQ
jgi:hypothetical protein